MLFYRDHHHGGEGAKLWLSAITGLKNRGVQDILIACIDGLSGFETAIPSSGYYVQAEPISRDS